MTTTALSSDIEIISIDSKLLPFHLGSVRIIESTHTFIHYIEIKPLFKLLSNIKNNYRITNTALNKPSNNDNNSYSEVLKNLLTHCEYLIDETDQKLNSLAPPKRNKRGLINVVGKASKWLFGTMDSEDANNLNKAIQILSSNQNSIKDQVQLQSSLTRELIDNYNATITTLTNNQETIKDKLNAFQDVVHNSLDDISKYIKAQNVLQQIILNCQNLITFLDNLEDAVMFAKLNTLHNAVMPISDMRSVTRILTRIYGKNKIPEFENQLSFYHLASPKVTYVDGKVVFAIYMPVLNSNSFEHYHLYPIPINNLTIIPQKPYLTLNSDLHQYEDEECPMIENTYFCENKLSPNEDDCAISLMQKADISNCRISPIHTKTTLSEQISRNYVLVIPAEVPMQIKKNCTKAGYSTIKGPSLLKVPDKCQISVSNSKYVNDERITNGSPFVLPEITSENQENQEEMVHIHLDAVKLDEISRIHRQSMDLRPPRLETYRPDKFTSLTFSILIISILTASIWLAIKRYKKHTMKKTQKSRSQISAKSQDAENNSSILFSDLRREELY